MEQIDQETAHGFFFLYFLRPDVMYGIRVVDRGVGHVKKIDRSRLSAVSGRNTNDKERGRRKEKEKKRYEENKKGVKYIRKSSSSSIGRNASKRIYLRVCMSKLYSVPAGFNLVRQLIYIKWWCVCERVCRKFIEKELAHRGLSSFPLCSRNQSASRYEIVGRSDASRVFCRLFTPLFSFVWFI